jgi:hypothetical protein
MQDHNQRHEGQDGRRRGVGVCVCVCVCVCMCVCVCVCVCVCSLSVPPPTVTQTSLCSRRRGYIRPLARHEQESANHVPFRCFVLLVCDFSFVENRLADEFDEQRLSSGHASTTFKRRENRIIHLCQRCCGDLDVYLGIVFCKPIPPLGDSIWALERLVLFVLGDLWCFCFV